MSFIIAVYVNEGMVLASDSRVSYNNTKVNGVNTTVLVGVHSSDTVNKTFKCPNNIGISTCGSASVKGLPITGFIEDFIRSFFTEHTKVSTVPSLIISYFQKLDPSLNIHFIIAGYEDEGKGLTQKLYLVQTNTGTIINDDTSSQGARWDGETSILSKVIQPTAIKNPDGSYTDLPNYSIPWNLYSLQDAINFAKYAVDITTQTMHFQNVNETVGGPVDILIIKPENAFWLKKKDLSA